MKKVQEIMASKKVKSALMFAGLVAIMCVSAFAADGGSSDAMAGITTSLTTGFKQVATDILALLGVGVVAAIGVVGVKMAVKAAIGFFKTLASK